MQKMKVVKVKTKDTGHPPPRQFEHTNVRLTHLISHIFIRLEPSKYVKPVQFGL